MVELGKRDLLTNGHIPLGPFVDNRAFFGVDLSQLLNLNPAGYQK
jgi:hypothetical protein